MTVAPAQTVDLDLIKKLVGDAQKTPDVNKALLDQLTALAGELQGVKTKQAESEARLKTLADYKEQTSLLFKTDTKPEAAKAATAFALKEQGWGEAQIAQYLADTFGTGTPDAATEGGGAPKGKPNAELEELKKQMADLTRARQFETAASKEKFFKDQVLEAIKSNAKITEILSTGKRLNPAFDAAKTTEALSKAVQDSAYNALVPIARAKGGSVEPADIEAAVKAAAENSTGLFRQVIGEPNMLGRTPETVAKDLGFDLGSLNKPIPEPDYNKMGSSADKDQALQEHTTNEFSRLAAQMAVAGSSQV